MIEISIALSMDQILILIGTIAAGGAVTYVFYIVIKGIML